MSGTGDNAVLDLATAAAADVARHEPLAAAHVLRAAVRGGCVPAYVMQQMGHTDASLALEIYNRVMERKRDTGARMDALVKGADWALAGASTREAVDPLSVPAT